AVPPARDRPGAAPDNLPLSGDRQRPHARGAEVETDPDGGGHGAMISPIVLITIPISQSGEKPRWGAGRGASTGDVPRRVLTTDFRGVDADPRKPRGPAPGAGRPAMPYPRRGEGGIRVSPWTAGNRMATSSTKHQHQSSPGSIERISGWA